jgi:membrane-associated HD superfamily phosphohydrolase
MNKKDTSLTIYIIFAYVLFLISWYIPQFLNKTYPEYQYLANWFFNIFYIGISGIAVPLYIVRKFDLKFNRKTTQKEMTIGIVSLVAVLIVGIIFSGAYSEIITSSFSSQVLLKYFLLFSGMALGICLHSFLLIPSLIENLYGGNIQSVILTVIISSSSVGLGFFVDSVLEDVELALIMGILGLFFATGYFMTKKFSMVFATFFFVMLANTLAEAKYHDYDWSTLIMSVLFYLAITYSLYLRKKTST